MNRFAVIIPYFGQFKPSISLFLESCNRNSDVDWFVFTDCEIPADVTLNINIHWVSTTLEHIKIMAQEKIGCKVALSRAYKLCDLKPFFGIIFRDYLKGYEYWGFGDVDVVYGRLSAYLDSIDYFRYDKINWMGHLCFVRNSDSCTATALEKVDETIDASKVLSNENNLGFDERDYNKKCLAKGMKIYTGKWAADIDVFYWRMRCVDLKTFHYLLHTREIDYAPKNYSRQMFALIDDSVNRIFLNNHQVHLEEFAYIHFRKEVPIHLDRLRTDSYIISRTGFWPLKGGSIALSDYNTVKELIDRYNNQENWLQELQCFWHYYREYSRKNKRIREKG